METGTRRFLAVVGAMLAIPLSLVASGGSAVAADYDQVQAQASWLRVDANGTWGGSLAMFGPQGGQLGILGRETLVPVRHQCTGQGTEGTSDDTWADITGESHLGQSATTIVSIAPSRRSATYSGPMQGTFFVSDGCTNSIIASGTWTMDVQLTLTALDRFTSANGALTTRGYDATGTMMFDGAPATVTAASISRTKGNL